MKTEERRGGDVLRTWKGNEETASICFLAKRAGRTHVCVFITELASVAVSLRMSAPKNENTVHDLLTLVQVAYRSVLVLNHFTAKQRCSPLRDN